MLEALLLTKLVEAKSMWTTPPHYTNDAQDIIKEALTMASDSKWEKPIDQILNPEYPPADYDTLMAMFLHNNQDYTEADLLNQKHKAYWEWGKECQDSDKRENRRVIDELKHVIQCLTHEIGDKVHRRNLQIDDLKRKLELKPKRYEAAELRTMGWEYNRLTPRDLMAIRSALGQKIGIQNPDAYQEAMNNLNLMYPRQQSQEDVEVTHNLHPELSRDDTCTCGHTRENHKLNQAEHPSLLDYNGICLIGDCQCQHFGQSPDRNIDIIICPKCHSEIAVDNPLDYDVDCDCGMTLTVKYTGNIIDGKPQ